MSTLIARLTAATQGSAELDAEVLRAAGWQPAKSRGFGGYWRRPSDGVLVSPPSPTRDLNAIQALIEAEGWEWAAGNIDEATGRYVGSVEYTAADHSLFMTRKEGATAPLAMCVAYLCMREIRE